MGGDRNQFRRHPGDRVGRVQAPGAVPAPARGRGRGIRSPPRGPRLTDAKAAGGRPDPYSRLAKKLLDRLGAGVGALADHEVAAAENVAGSDTSKKPNTR